MKILSNKKLSQQKTNFRKKRNISVSFHRWLKVKQDTERNMWFGCASKQNFNSFSGFINKISL